MKVIILININVDNTKITNSQVPQTTAHESSNLITFENKPTTNHNNNINININKLNRNHSQTFSNFFSLKNLDNTSTVSPTLFPMKNVKDEQSNILKKNYFGKSGIIRGKLQKEFDDVLTITKQSRKPKVSESIISDRNPKPSYGLNYDCRGISGNQIDKKICMNNLKVNMDKMFKQCETSNKRTFSLSTHQSKRNSTNYQSLFSTGMDKY